MIQHKRVCIYLLQYKNADRKKTSRRAVHESTSHFCDESTVRLFCFLHNNIHKFQGKNLELMTRHQLRLEHPDSNGTCRLRKQSTTTRVSVGSVCVNPRVQYVGAIHYNCCMSPPSFESWLTLDRWIESSEITPVDTNRMWPAPCLNRNRWSRTRCARHRWAFSFLL